MSINLLRKLKLIIFAMATILLTNSSYAKDISGYDEFVALYGQGLSEEEAEAFKKSIQDEEKDALDDILKRELSSTFAERQYIFRQSESLPTKLYEINEKYVAVGYEKTLHYKGNLEKSAYVLLYEIKGPQELIYADSYIFLKGRSSLDQYKQIETTDLCQKFPILAEINECGESSAQQVVKNEASPPPAKPAESSQPKSDAEKTSTPTTTSPATKPAAPKTDPMLKQYAQKTQENTEAVSNLSLKVNALDENLRRINTKINNKADRIHYHSGRDITSGIIMQEFIDAAIARDRELSGATGRVSFDDTTDTYVKGLENRIMELESTIKRLTAVLNGVSRVEDTIVFSGVNVQVVNGTGTTSEEINGLGNLVVGYNKPREEIDETIRTGSHNIIVGDEHNYTSYGGLVAGLSNTISGAYSCVAGGLRNVASGDFSAVSGGHFKTAEGVYAVSQPDSAKPAKDKEEKKGCFLSVLGR